MSDVMMRVDQEPVLWPGHMGLQVGGQRSEPVLWSGQGPRGTKREQGPVGALLNSVVSSVSVGRGPE
ncbi:unnamed protein product [Gadus morhua 'NCC']